MNRLPPDSLAVRPASCASCIQRKACKKDPKKCTASGVYVKTKSLNDLAREAMGLPEKGCFEDDIR